MAHEAKAFIELLRKDLGSRVERNPLYSLRAYSRALGLSPSTLSRIFAGKQIPASRTQLRIIRKLGLSPEQLADLENPSDQYFQSIRSVEADEFRVIADWYHYAILELTYLKDFKAEATWIARQLGISRTQASLAIRRLKDLGLLKKEGSRLKKSDAFITTANKNLSSAAHQRRQKQVLEKSLAALENEDVSKRSHTSVTMAIDPDLLPKAKEMILEFNRKLCQFLESGKRKQVYELSLGLFPIQKERDTQ